MNQSLQYLLSILYSMPELIFLSIGSFSLEKKLSLILLELLFKSYIKKNIDININHVKEFVFHSFYTKLKIHLYLFLYLGK